MSKDKWVAIFWIFLSLFVILIGIVVLFSLFKTAKTNTYAIEEIGDVARMMGDVVSTTANKVQKAEN